MFSASKPEKRWLLEAAAGMRTLAVLAGSTGPSGALTGRVLVDIV